MKDVCNGRSTVLYDAKDAITKLNTPSVKDPKVTALVSTTTYKFGYVASSELTTSVI